MSSSLRERAIREIRAAIVYGSLGRGHLYSAVELAETMDMSVTPVREALQHLSERRMVRALRNRGFEVVQPTLDELEATLELRQLLEVPTVRKLAGALGEAQIAELALLVDGGQQAAGAGDLAAFLELDREFHRRLLGCGGNERLVEFVDRLRDRLRFEGFRGVSGAVTLQEVADGHARILDAVACGRADDAAAATREHLRMTRRVWPTELADGATAA